MVSLGAVPLDESWLLSQRQMQQAVSVRVRCVCVCARACLRAFVCVHMCSVFIQYTPPGDLLLTQRLQNRDICHKMPTGPIQSFLMSF